MLTTETRNEIAAYLAELVLDQRAVRRCEVEGMIMPIEHKLEMAYELGLVSMYDLDHLLDLLKRS